MLGILLALAAGLFVPDVCADCKPGTVCLRHVRQYNDALPELLKRYSSGKPVEREQVLVDIAGLNREHENAPSRRVTEALAVGLQDSALAVRLATIELLRGGQHEETTEKLLCRQLNDLGEHLAEWADIEALQDDPSPAELDAYRAQVDAEIVRVQRDLDALVALSGVVIDLSFAIDPKLRKKNTKSARREAERQKKKLEEAVARTRAELEALMLPPNALVLGEQVASILTNDASARGKASIIRFYEQVLRFSPSQSIGYARMLTEIGTRDAVEAVVDSLRTYRRFMDAHARPRPDQEAWGPAVHELLLEAARASGAEQPDLQCDEGVFRAWKRWFSKNKKSFPSRLGS